MAGMRNRYTPAPVTESKGIGIYRGLSWVFQLLILLAGLVFAPFSTLIAIMAMLKNKHDKRSLESLVRNNFYLAMGLLMLEVGVAHWLFPVTNFAATYLLGLLGGPLVWIIFGCAAAALLITCGLSYHFNNPDRTSSNKISPFERYGLPILAFILAPFSTILGLLFSWKKGDSLALLIRNNPFIAFGFAILEVGLLYWLVPPVNFIFGLIFGSALSVTSAALWVLVALAVVFAVCSLWGHKEKQGDSLGNDLGLLGQVAGKGVNDALKKGMLDKGTGLRGPAKVTPTPGSDASYDSYGRESYCH